MLDYYTKTHIIRQYFFNYKKHIYNYRKIGRKHVVFI